MKPGQRQTAIAWAVFAAVQLLAGLGLLGWEFYAAAKWGADATLSVVFQTAWANYPWPFFIAGLLSSAIVFYLLGHLTAQNRDVYDRQRRGGRMR